MAGTPFPLPGGPVSTIAVRQTETIGPAADFRPRRRIATFELWAFRTQSLSRNPHENRDDNRTTAFVAAETKEEALALAAPAPPGCEWRVVTVLRRSGVGVEPTQPWATRPDRL